MLKTYIQLMKIWQTSIWGNLLFILILFFPTSKDLTPKDFFLEEHKFISYGKLSTWKGVAADWDSAPKVYIYNRRIFKGHADFISKGLGKKINFEEFKYFSRDAQYRKFLPFYIYDLRNINFHYKKRKYKFALRIQDYNYKDEPEKLIDEIVKLCYLIYGESGREFSIRPLIVLNKQENSSLHINRLSLYFKEKKYNSIALDELLELSGSKKIEVLNSGIAVGKLKLFKDEKELESATNDDIVVLNFLPDKIPPVAGIVTLQPQTPLSHVNLLAKNRGTFNMYMIQIHSLPGFKELIGKYVYLYDQEDQVSIHEVSSEFVSNHRLRNKVPKIEVPKIKASFRKIVPLLPEFSEFLTAQQIGTKASNYYKILQIIPKHVRPGFAIGFKPYFEVLDQGANILIEDLIRDKNKFTMLKRKEKLKEIREKITSGKVHRKTISSIRQVINAYYPNTRIRLRSSTNCEDLPGFNGAGLYISKGFQTHNSDEELNDKILEVYASFWNDFAFEEREYFGISHKETGMAILIQEAFVGELANGVALSIPIDSKKVNLLINAQVEEISVANPSQGIIAESFYISPGSIQPDRINTYSSIQNVFLNNEKFANILLDLKNNLVQLHKSFISKDPNFRDKFGIDIEFKIMQENNKPKLYIKQARLLKY
jgi:hypothetical protein